MIKYKPFGQTGLLVCVLLAFTTNSHAGPLLTAGANQLHFADFENLYNSSGSYIKGNTAPVAGDFLVGTFNITLNSSNGWASDPNFGGTRDTYTGVFVEQILAIGTAGGQTTLVLGPDGSYNGTTINTFTGGGNGDTSSISLPSALNPANGDMFAIYHQSSTSDPLFSAGTNGGSAPSTSVSTDMSNSQSGSLYLVLGFQPGANGSYDTSLVTGGSTYDDNGFAYTQGSFPPNNFSAKGYTGLQVDQNNTGLTFSPIKDSNENLITGSGGLAPTLRTPFTLETVLGYSTTGQFTGTPPGNSPWDFSSSDPANAVVVVPEPTSSVLLAMGLFALGFSTSARRLRKKTLMA